MSKRVNAAAGVHCPPSLPVRVREIAKPRCASTLAGPSLASPPRFVLSAQPNPHGIQHAYLVVLQRTIVFVRLSTVYESSTASKLSSYTIYGPCQLQLPILRQEGD